MTKLPRLKAVQIIKVLEKRGFKLSRQSGGHKIYKDNRGKRVTVSDDIDFVEWSNDYQHYLAIRLELEKQLENVA